MKVPLPPDGVSFAENGTPTSHTVGAGVVASGFDAVALSGFRTVMASDLVSERPSARAALYVATKEPSAVGVPETTPVEELSDTPGGSSPETTLHVTGLDRADVELAPFFMSAVRSSVYGAPIVPGPADSVVTRSRGSTLIENGRWALFGKHHDADGGSSSLSSTQKS